MAEAVDPKCSCTFDTDNDGNCPIHVNGCPPKPIPPPLRQATDGAGITQAITRVAPPNEGKVPDADVNHPSHYGGKGNVYEAIKVIDAWGLGFGLGNAIKYICRAGKKRRSTALQDLEKARWYLDHEIVQQGGTSWNPK